MAQPLNLLTHELTNGHTIEASAGTGKTYSVAALVTRAIATDDTLRIDKVLITTFTRFAAAELRDRVRRRLLETADRLENDQTDPNDPVLGLLLADGSQRPRYIRNLRRAVVNFDNATIGTIHSVCSKILALAGLTALDDAAEELTRRVVAEVVNDRLVSESVKHGRVWNEIRVRKALEARLSSPLAEQWFDDSLDPAILAEVGQLALVLDELVIEVNRRTAQHPSFDDLIRRAEEVLRGEMGDDIRARFADRYTHAFIDEAQDTDQLQWRLFHHIFPKHNPTSDHKLIAVGDPKQAIYAFRGADINAYLEVRDISNMSTLGTNFRSDPPVIEGLNALFGGRSLGEGIEYTPVTSDPKKSGSRVRGVNAVEAIDLIDANNQPHAALAAVGQVQRLLDKGEIFDRDEWRQIKPGDVCVLAGSNSLVRAIHRNLQRLSIPAVASGAESVFADTTAIEFRRVLEALDRVAHVGRVRNAASTSFFGFSLGDPRLLPDDLAPRAKIEDDVVLVIQEKLVVWRQTLVHRGIAALAAEITSDPVVMQSLVEGSNGERHLADFSHIIDLLHVETRGRGISPSEALEVFDVCSRISGASDTVSRRVESDNDAVQVMTVHKAKGLEFPCVVVAELWKPRGYDEYQDIPKFRLPVAPAGYRNCIDIGWVLGHSAIESQRLVTQSQCDEQKRLIYVAFTRSKNHLSFLWQSSAPDPSMLAETINLDAINTTGANGGVLISGIKQNQPNYGSQFVLDNEASPTKLIVAGGPQKIGQTYCRTSFSGITSEQKSSNHSTGRSEYSPVDGGSDENTNWLVNSGRYASPSTPAGVNMPLGRIMGGAYVGRLLHQVYEVIDTSVADLRAEVEHKCRRILVGSVLRNDIEAVVEGVHLSLTTPLGERLNHATLADITPDRRLAELHFEMAIADVSAGVKASDFGRILIEVVPQDDPLQPYAALLAHESFDIPLTGLINGSIDAVLQLGSDEQPELWITDYKSNRLDREGDTSLIAAYGYNRLSEAMIHHHYPLQALIYGTAMFRYLRWRAPHLKHPSDHVKGFAFFFIRGMVGTDTPPGTGVFTWQAPTGLWKRLSDRLAGDGI